MVLSAIGKIESEWLAMLTSGGKNVLLPNQLYTLCKGNLPSRQHDVSTLVSGLCAGAAVRTNWLKKSACYT
ncbi:hypothetical protein HOLleu_20175 [Holothuria leucospilota]|uniref:Uncharacterized protein n=1 Tax=Holothuria leucospilota TaxID=206669 RepID=A0A9Q1H8A7_HOLLE|nr:hypothetical protein HOLleu_20175 [Holothuria leucospilota]